ncbi:hypothetical protein CLOM_g24262 [Closterium sp. NIES-68]|nr:hypothetical protein CLOM_g24262 [Closterium sp. NIES-68]
MKSRTPIHHLPDDILIRILWHFNRPAPWETYTVDHTDFINSWMKESCGMSVNQDIYCDESTPIPSPPSSMNAAWSLLIASVCRRWRSLDERHVTALLVRPFSVVSRQDLASAVSCFPNLTHLHLCEESAETLDDEFLAHLASACPKQTALHVGGRITPEKYDARKHLHPVTEAGLDKFFLQCPRLEQLSLFCLHKDAKLPASFFNLSRLKALALPDASALDVPVFANFSALSTLWMTSSGLKHQQLSSLVQLPSLTSLSLSAQLPLLPTDQQPAAFTFSQLPRLKSLRFSSSSCTRFQQIFSAHSPCTSLEQLSISGSDNLEGLPDDIGDLLPNLRELSISSCKKISQLPEGFASLSRLEMLKISRADRNFSLPGNFGLLPALKTLVLDSVPLSHPPDSFCLLTSLENLIVYESKSFGKLPVGFCTLTALKKLCLIGLHDLMLPDDLGMLSNLQTLRLSGVYNRHQRQLPSSITRLASLTKLDIDSCAVYELPEGMENLTSLQRLQLHKLYIKEVPEAITHLTRLEFLTIFHCMYLEMIPRRPDFLTRLRTLQLDTIEPLNYYPESLPASLEILSWGDFNQTVPMPDLSRLPSLTALSLRMVAAKRGLAVSRSLSHLQHLELILSKNAKKLPFVLRSLNHLRSLEIHGVGKVKELPADFGSAMPLLQKLRIQDAQELEHLPGDCRSSQADFSPRCLRCLIPAPEVKSGPLSCSGASARFSHEAHLPVLPGTPQQRNPLPSPWTHEPDQTQELVAV